MKTSLKGKIWQSREPLGGCAFRFFTSNAVRFRPTRCERYALEATLRRICFA
ncbi:hypothetical protein ACU9ZQ_000621 [Campylobacter upsaliensis]